MKEYEIKNGELFHTLKIVEGDKTWSTPFDSGSSRWQEYLRYTAWVEAGNNPEDFWTADQETI